MVLSAAACRKGVLAAFADARGDRADEPGGEAPATVVRVGADRADLGPAGRVNPPPASGRGDPHLASLAGHGDQPPPVPDAEIGAQFDGPLQKGARSGAGDQVQDLGDVVEPEPYRFGRGFGP